MYHVIFNTKKSQITAEKQRKILCSLWLQAFRWGCGAVGSAFEWHSKGQGFESPQLHQ